jgi:hypothetical protein
MRKFGRCESRIVSALDVVYQCVERAGHLGAHRARATPLPNGYREPITWTDEQARRFGLREQSLDNLPEG